MSLEVTAKYRIKVSKDRKNRHNLNGFQTHAIILDMGDMGWLVGMSTTPEYTEPS